MHPHPTPKDPGGNFSRIGFGSYRVDSRTSANRDALRLALRSGTAWIDTSTNYGWGSSEELIGQVLTEFPDQRIQVISKAGYLQGPLLREATRFEEVTHLGPDLAHCIHPSFLREMLGRSRERLGGKLDCYLIHNPEYFLKKSQDHREYYSRLEKAFHGLEDAVDAGWIQSYGVSSNTLIEDREHPEFTSLEVLLEIRERISQTRGRPSRFQALQFPLNLFESEAALLSNQGPHTVLELASQAGLTTFANRPLNAFTRKHLVRLASFRKSHHVDFRHFLSRIFDEVNSLEASLPMNQMRVRPVFWGHLLRENFKDLVDLEQWRNFLNWRIRPSLLELEPEVCRSSEGERWWKEYEPRLEGLLQAIDSFMENLAAERSDRLRDRLVQAVPALRSASSLSQAALRVYLATPGLNVILLGMRDPLYVQDALAAAQAKALTAEEALLALDAAHEFLEEFENDVPAHGANEETH